MRRLWFLAAAMSFAVLPGLAAADFPARDDFSAYPEGSKGDPKWGPAWGDWRIRQGEMTQQSSEFDRGILFTQRPHGAFVLRARVRSLGGFTGGGLFFNAEGKNDQANSQMVRVDEEAIIWGYIDGDKIYHPVGDSPAEVVPGKWHEIKVVVSDVLPRYNLYLDGKLVRAHVRLDYLEGYVGLQSSGGPQAFDDFEVRPATPEEIAELGTGEELVSPQGVAVGPDGTIFVLHRGAYPLLALAPDGTPLPHPERPRMAPADTDLRGLTILGDRRMVAVNTTQGRLYLFRPDGSLEGSVAPSGEGALSRPQDVTADSRGHLLVADTGNDRVVALDEKGTFLAAFGTQGKEKGQFSQPTGLAFHSRGRLLVCDSGNSRVEVFSWDPEGLKAEYVGEIFDSLNARDVAVNSRGEIVVLGQYAAYEPPGGIRLYAPDDFRVLASFAGWCMEPISTESAIAAGPDNEVYIADGPKNRIAIAPADLHDPLPILSPSVDGTEVTVSWTSSRNSLSPVVEYHLEAQPEEPARVVGSPTKYATRQQSVTLGQLSPATYYQVRFSPALPTIPAQKWSRWYRVFTNPGRGRTAYLNLPVLVVIYLKAQWGENGEVVSLPADALGDKVQKQFDKVREWYYRNSYCKFHMDLDYLVIPDKVAKLEGGLMPAATVREDVRQAFQAEGKGRKAEDYPSFIVTWAAKGYRADAPEDEGAVGGGGLTPYGFSFFALDGVLSWLGVHEFHHQVDAFFYRVGREDYYLNHPDPSVMPGRYAHHYDCNSFITRTWPPENWFQLLVGKAEIVTDADNDGVPDDAPELPFDELRVGSSPASGDSDGDGLGDLAEAMAGSFRGSDPTRPDTDGDGILDGADPYPLYQAQPELPAGTPKIDGNIEPGEWHLLTDYAGPWASGSIYQCWDEKNLYLAVTASEPFLLHWELDTQDDGIFPGWSKDNWAIEVDAQRAGQAPAARVTNAPQPTVAASVEEGKAVVEIALPAQPEGFRLMSGSHFGQMFQILKAGRFFSVFDPWEFPRFVLVSRREGGAAPRSPQ